MSTEKHPTSRQEALERGFSKYYTGKPCVHGHLSKRQAVSGNCIECFKTVHKEKIKESNRRHTLENGNNGYAHRRKVNPAYKKRAKNGSTLWSQADVALLTKRHEDGTYVYTTPYLANSLGRSYTAIERARAEKTRTPGKPRKAEEKP